MRDLQWFKDRIGERIWRKHPEDNGWGVVRNLDSDKAAHYYHNLQEKGYEYKDDRKPVDPFNDTSTITIHRAPPAECQSCSA